MNSLRFLGQVSERDGLDHEEEEDGLQSSLYSVIYVQRARFCAFRFLWWNGGFALCVSGNILGYFFPFVILFYDCSVFTVMAKRYGTGFV